MNSDGKPFVAYRVSSRSFPNRQCLKFENRAAIVPKEGFEKDIFENTYINLGLNCHHMNIKDAIAYSLLTMDYEKDDYNTPRIAAGVTSTTKQDEYECYIGIANDKKILVEQVPYGDAVFISTYGSQVHDLVEFDAKTAADSAKFIFDEGTFANYKKPVTSCAAVFDGEWTIDVYNP